MVAFNIKREEKSVLNSLPLLAPYWNELGQLEKRELVIMESSSLYLSEGRMKRN